MKITKKKIREFFASKGFGTKELREAMTAAQTQTLATEFKDEFGEDFATAIAAASQKAPVVDDTLVNEVTAALKGADGLFATDDDDDDSEGGEGGQTPVTLATKVTKVVKMAKTLKDDVTKMAKNPETPTPGKVTAKVVAINSGKSTEKYLFGIENPHFDRSKPWNQVAATKKSLEVLAVATGISGKWEHHASEFKKEFNAYAESFADRINTLHAEEGLDSVSLSTMDFTGFDGTKWGEEYVVRRQDAMIAYLRKLPSVRNLFPVMYGVQNKQVMTNSFLTNFSQGYQSGRVFKGKHSVEPMEARVTDVMFKHNFENMKALESQYIGYLNRENSDPIKWSMIEWLMVQTLIQLNNEWNERRIKGVYIKPITGEAGHHMFGSDGVIRTLNRYKEEFLLQAFNEFGKYTRTTILDHVESLTEKVNLILPSLKGYRLHINEKHIPWYLDKYREKYGEKRDFTKTDLVVNDYSLDGIVGVPNMGNSCLMWITMPGNVELYEMAAGEMSNFYFQRDLEELLVASYWKEGTGAYMVGKKHATYAELVAEKFKNQYIFLTEPKTTLVADATTADATDDEIFISQENTAATTLTDFVGAEEGVVYRLECGHVANATKIAKVAKFSNVNAWTPSAIGDFIEVYYDETTDKFVEVRRKVTA